MLPCFWLPLASSSLSGRLLAVTMDAALSVFCSHLSWDQWGWKQSLRPNITFRNLYFIRSKNINKYISLIFHRPPTSLLQAILYTWLCLVGSMNLDMGSMASPGPRLWPGLVVVKKMSLWEIDSDPDHNNGKECQEWRNGTWNVRIGAARAEVFYN